MSDPLVIHQTLADQVFARIVHAIVVGNINAGSALSEDEMAERFSVRRGPPREAIFQVEAKRLAFRVAHFGARVVKLSLDNLRSLFGLREWLECMACRLADGPFVSTKQGFDAGRLLDKVLAIMGIAAKGYELVAEIAPTEKSILVPKKHPSAFFGTPLASNLINTGADTLVVTGCSTSGCVRGTVVDGFAYNFRVMVPQDAVFDRSEVSHAVNLFDMSEKYADVMPTDDILTALKSIKKAT